MSTALTNSFPSEHFVPVVSPHAYAVEIDGEAVLLDQASNRLHLLNSGATLLWSCFDGQSSLAEICTLIADSVGVPYADVLRESLSAVDGLSREGLLVTDLLSVQGSDALPIEGVVPEPVNH